MKFPCAFAKDANYMGYNSLHSPSSLLLLPTPPPLPPSPSVVLVLPRRSLRRPPFDLKGVGVGAVRRKAGGLRSAHARPAPSAAPTPYAALCHIHASAHALCRTFLAAPTPPPMPFAAPTPPPMPSAALHRAHASGRTVVTAAWTARLPHPRLRQRPPPCQRLHPHPSLPSIAPPPQPHPRSTPPSATPTPPSTSSV